MTFKFNNLRKNVQAESPQTMPHNNNDIYTLLLLLLILLLLLLLLLTRFSNTFIVSV